jgi:hypothetical protein
VEGDEVIYFLFDAYSECVKIGYTNGEKSLATRLSILQTGNPNELVLLGTSSGDKRREKSIHRDLHEYRMHGEWFSMKAKIVRETTFSILGDSAYKKYQLSRYTSNYQGYKLILKSNQGKQTYHMRILLGDGEIKQTSLKTDSYELADEIAKEIERRILNVRSPGVKCGAFEMNPVRIKNIIKRVEYDHSRGGGGV